MKLSNLFKNHFVIYCFLIFLISFLITILSFATTYSTAPSSTAFGGFPLSCEGKADGDACSSPSDPLRRCCAGVCCTASLLGCCDKDGDGTKDCQVENHTESCPRTGTPISCCEPGHTHCCNSGTPNAICCADSTPKCCYSEPRCVLATTPCTPYCGDGVIDGDEFCDGQTNCPLPSACINECKACCGNGTQEPGEACDPPNTNICTDRCQARIPFCGDGWVTPPEVCDGTCFAGICINECKACCGNNVIEPGEDCELPNTDTCTYLCKTRPPFCGDGFITPPEICEGSFGCPGGYCIDCNACCGNNVIEPGENCEPPGTETCTDLCQTRAPFCGDGWVTPPEVCDGVVNCSAPKVCSSDCKSCCGNGVQELGEVCDGQANCSSPKVCNPNCKACCGNGTTEPGEACDDGNNISDDGCSATCSIEPCTQRRPPNCGTLPDCGPNQWCIANNGICVCTSTCTNILVGANCNTLGRCPGNTSVTSTCNINSTPPPACACPTTTTGNACTNEINPTSNSCLSHSTACLGCHYVAGPPKKCSCN